MIIPPFYSTPTDHEFVHHYRTVADAIGIPIMAYNNPATAVALTTSPRTSIQLPMARTDELRLEADRDAGCLAGGGDRPGDGARPRQSSSP